jgi:hypothetical protein
LIQSSARARKRAPARGRARPLLAVYQGGSGPLSPVTSSTQIVNDHDAMVNTTAETLAVDRFSVSNAAIDTACPNRDTDTCRN